jgi:hypothetical protein
MTDQFKPNFESEEEPLPVEQAETLNQEEAAVSRLRASPDEEAMQSRLRVVDQLLHRAPLVKPGVAFAERIIDRLRRRQTINHQVAAGMALGMSAAMIIVSTLIAALLLAILAIIINWTSIYQGFLAIAGAATYVSDLVFEKVSQAISESPMLLALSLASIPLLIIWLWIMRRIRATGLEA